MVIFLANKSNRKAMKRNWSKQKANPALNADKSAVMVFNEHGAMQITHLGIR